MFVYVNVIGENNVYMSYVVMVELFANKIETFFKRSRARALHIYKYVENPLRNDEILKDKNHKQ